MLKSKQIIGILTVLFLGLLVQPVCHAQQGGKPEGAFVRSLLVPGWGHYYANSDQWTRGQVHLGTEIALIVSFFGFSIRANNLEDQYETLASLRAHVDISERSRAFQLAIGDFNSLQEYNDFQLRSRNWNRLYEDHPANRWNWETEEDRNNYNNLRSDVDRVKNQLPAILGLMVVNRVVSALSAYNRAKGQSNIPEVSIMPVSTPSEQVGVVTRLNLHF